jgi:hypothetical protein
MRNVNWFVDSIISTRIKHGVTEYLITWQGFDSSHASWEPEKNLSPGLLLAYRSKERNGKYRISGASATATLVSLAPEITIFHSNGDYNGVLNNRLEQYLSNGLYTNGLGFNE